MKVNWAQLILVICALIVIIVALVRHDTSGPGLFGGLGILGILLLLYVLQREE
ncbi:hypothetical protein IV38_GL001596 [Lactobacillus selangorensis]|uniref:Uncharacterized protein n=1 Tax=Lactobacillus selangorensis TaxID=81857 RepID=A0A0R2FHN4_9LACO|nr:hypothetical protein [Lactobacillus selangorensis]KRN28145.1 hypothetical protein IV38_GL001596 [Lactobacillus selangorensis]